jgi:hypothetical protein
MQNLLCWLLLLHTSILLVLLITADGAYSDASKLRSVFLNKPVHFSASDGSDILTASGNYEVKAE